MSHPLLWAFLAGVLATGLFVLVVLLQLGFFFLFLPTLPLFWLGLGHTPKLALIAAMMASLIIITLIDPATGSFFLLMFGLPAWYISRLSLLSREDGGQAVWFPLGIVFTRIVLYGCLLVVITALYYTTQPLSLDALLSQQIRSAFSDLQDEYAETIDALAGTWMFLILPMGIWLWTLVLYAHAWFTHRALVRRKKNIRPDFAIDMFPMPPSMLSLLVLCALASLLGGPTLSFVGKSLLIALLCPYFLLGLALAHRLSKSWPSRGFFLFFMYAAIFTQFWPALILAGAGLMHQIKHLSSRGDSSKG